MRRFICTGIICLILGCIPYMFSQALDLQENNPPEVKIIQPNEGDTFGINDLVNYEISISDIEDGETEYDEIKLNEVFLAIKYLNDTDRKEDDLNTKTKANYEPLVEMGVRNCFNCHKLREPLIGPSFRKIAEKYKEESGAIEKLAKKVISGGSNVWGDDIMPSHPELTMSSAKELVDWILSYNFNDEKDIIVGSTGSFRIKEPMEKSDSGIYVLTAFYTDHGANGNLDIRKLGEQTITIRIE